MASRSPSPYRICRALSSSFRQPCTGKNITILSASYSSSVKISKAEHHSPASLSSFIKTRDSFNLHPSPFPQPTAHPSFLSAIKATCPIPYQIGLDTCSIPRIHKLISKSESSYLRFRDRVLTPTEVSLQSIPPIKRAEFLAGRWAAKEAVIKAMASSIWGTEGKRRTKVFMHDIVILPAPVVEAVKSVDFESGEAEGGEVEVVEGESLEEVRKRKGPLRAFVQQDGAWEEVLCSVTHDGDMATAMAFVVKGKS